MENRLTYNLTNISGSGSLTGFLGGIDGLTGGLFIILILLALFFVVLLGLINWGLFPALASSTLLTSVVGIVFILSGLLSSSYLAYFILLPAGVAIMGFIMSRQEG